MKEIELFEKIIAGEINYEDSGVNHTMYWAYRTSKEVGNDTINFHEVIWEYDIEPIVKSLAENRIYEFTISSTFSGLIPVLTAFEKLGFHICGTTEVNAPYKDFMSKDYAKIPAIRMRG